MVRGLDGQVQPMVIGLALTVLMAGISAVLWGGGAVPGALIFGCIATVIQLLAHRLALRPTRPRSPFPAGWLAGTAMRLGGVALLGVLVSVDRQTFAPLPAALGYLGVLIPLLMLELQKS